MEALDLFAGSLQGAAPVIDGTDLTRHWSLMRSFPSGPAQRRCYTYLCRKMLATPDRPGGTRKEFERLCRKRFGVTVESFAECWSDANKATGAGWNLPGRRRR
jgi:hypothetical protein